MRAVVAARELLALGYRRPGLAIMDAFDSRMAHRCSAGFWAVQEYVAGLERIPICRIDAGDTRALGAWVRRHRPDVVLGTNARLLDQLAAGGWRAPRDLGWVHLDWLPEHRPQAGVHGNSELTGAAAVDLVVSQLHRGETGPPPHAVHHLVSGVWIPGDTLRRMGPPRDLDASFFAELQPG